MGSIGKTNKLHLRENNSKKQVTPNPATRMPCSDPCSAGLVVSGTWLGATAELDEIASSPWRPLVVSHGLDGLVFGYLAL